MNSIRGRLLVWLLLSWSFAGMVAAVILYRTAQSEANQVFDHHLKQVALTLRDQPFEDQDIMGTLEEEADYDFVVQVWDESRVKLYSSHTEASLPQVATAGYTTIQHGGETWRVFLLTQEGPFIQVAQPMAVRQSRAANLALRTVTPFLVLMPIMGLIIGLTVSKGLAPLESFARAIRERDHHSLEPIVQHDASVELKPMLQELNDLLARLRSAMDAQRAFTADAAHELRTPLTALQLQAQLAERAQDPQAREEAFEQLRAGLKRSIQLVQQLLALARTEPGVPLRRREFVDLTALLRETVVEYTNLAQAKGVDLGIPRSDTVSITGDAEGLRALVRNLIDNGVRYTQEGGKVDVALYVTEDGPRLEVSDNGPGIPLEERERVFDRFHRGDGALLGDTSGSGLGLAIVKNVARQHAAQVTLHDVPEPSGLMVRVQFRAPVASSGE